MRIARLGFSTMAVILLAAPAIAAGETIVVVASPQRVEYVMPLADLPGNRDPDTLAVGSVYKTRLLVKQVIAGSWPEKTVTLNLTASSYGVLKKNKNIVIVFVKQRDGLEAVGWRELRTVACVPAEFLDGAVKSSLAPQPNGEYCHDVAIH